jgi:hypothetical protein
MVRKNLLSVATMFLFVATSLSQSTDSTSKFSFSGYVDAYYAYYTDSVGDGSYQKFPSISSRNGFGLNTAMFTAQYDAEKVRGMAVIHYGDVARSAWSATFNPIMEAHVGVRLHPKLWLDAGFFRTHFGTEGLLPKENFTSSVSVCTFYEPYFESGFRFNYIPNDKLTINLYVLSGYNMYEDNNNKKSIGALITYALGDKGNIGYSNYIGDDTPTAGDSISHLLFHNNLFFNYQVGKLKMQIGGDYCMKKNSHITNPKETATMYSGVTSLKYLCNTKYAVYARGEVFNDPQGVMSGVILDKKNKFTGFELWGVTAGAEYKPTDNSYIRLEGRQLMMDGDQEIFRFNKSNSSNRMEILLNLGVSF